MLELLKEYDLLAAKPSSIPVEVHTKLLHSTDNLFPDPTVFRQLVGKLMYVQLIMPSIAYSVHILSQFMDKPSNTHLNAAYRVLKYLKNAPGQGLFLAANSELKLIAYSDSDWGGCTKTRRSLTGFCIFLENSLIS